jgi:single-stranded-DNA-specific exonuclease
VLLSVLRSLDANVDFYIPNRSSEGYGLNLKAVSVLASKHRTKLLITCDCGVSNFSEINLAKSLGVDTLVLDHHTMPELLPPAVAVVHPKLLNEGHPLFHLPGVGVAYKVCEALLAKFDRASEVEALQDYVTLGMIADLVPLVDENRYLVKIGLPKLVASTRPGIRALLAQVGGKEDTDLVALV